MASPPVAPDRGFASSATPDLSAHGIARPGTVYANLSTPALTELVLTRKEGQLSESGAIVAYTGHRTGRSP